MKLGGAEFCDPGDDENEVLDHFRAVFLSMIEQDAPGPASAGNGESVPPLSERRGRMRKQRKHYTAEEKVAILRRHLVENEPVSQLCDELAPQPTVFYR